MKKFIAIVFTMILVLSFSITAFATDPGLNAAEQAVLDEIESTRVLGKNGWSFAVPAEYANAARNYFLTIDMTDAQKTAIISYIQQGKDIIKAEGDRQNFAGSTYNLRDMSKDARSKVLDLGQKACLETGATLVYTSSNNIVTITNADGQVVFAKEPIIKATGETFSFGVGTIAVIAAVVVVMGSVVLLVVASKKGLLVRK